MKISDPIMFGYMVKVFYKPVFDKHAEVVIVIVVVVFVIVLIFTVGVICYYYSYSYCCSIYC